MYAQLITVKVKPDKLDEFQALYEEYVNPEIRGTPGYQGFYLLLDRENNEAISVTLWESREAAEENEEINLYLEQRASYPLYSESPLRRGYEVAVRA